MKPVLKKSIWLSYDLGLKGNYSALFNFLDNNQAVDCGNGLAYFKYDNRDLLNSDDLIKKLTDELFKMLDPSPGDRIYAIWNDDTKLARTVKGKFLIGSRKRPAWHGYRDFTFDTDFEIEEDL